METEIATDVQDRLVVEWIFIDAFPNQIGIGRLPILRRPSECLEKMDSAGPFGDFFRRHLFEYFDFECPGFQPVREWFFGYDFQMVWLHLCPGPFDNPSIMFAGQPDQPIFMIAGMVNDAWIEFEWIQPGNDVERPEHPAIENFRILRAIQMRFTASDDVSCRIIDCSFVHLTQ